MPLSATESHKIQQCVTECARTLTRAHERLLHVSVEGCRPGRPVRQRADAAAAIPRERAEAVQRRAATKGRRRLVHHPERALLRAQPLAGAQSRPKDLQVRLVFIFLCVLWPNLRRCFDPGSKLLFFLFGFLSRLCVQAAFVSDNPPRCL